MDREPTAYIPDSIRDIFPGDFVYHLPPERIAGYPLPERDASRLLVYRNGNISEDLFRNLDSLLDEGSLLVYNDTRVIQARLVFYKSSGARIEIFCLEPEDPTDYAQNFASMSTCTWRCLVGNARKWKTGILQKTFTRHHHTFLVTAEMSHSGEGYHSVRFSWDAPLSFGEILDIAGLTPIPPYLGREAEAADRERYQTVYSRINGSVAAPTAGLHFTDEVLKKLGQRNIRRVPVLLHTGAGTFKPVQADNILDHVMHAEYFRISKKSIETVAGHPGKVIAVGTTTVRCLESLYFIASQVTANTGEPVFSLGQWEPYTMKRYPPAAEALNNLLTLMQARGWETIEGSTRIMLVPGYRFTIPDAMLTNFHMPRSSLLMLIAAFTGNDWKKIYAYALEKGFRFLSYGDTSLLYRKQQRPDT